MTPAEVEVGETRVCVLNGQASSGGRASRVEDSVAVASHPRATHTMESAETLDCSGPIRLPETPDVPRIFARGEVLCGAYQVGDVLGTGGMSQVLEARDLRLGRTVAIKACRPSVSPTLLHREGHWLSTFSHPSIVAIHDIGVHDGVDFLVLERLYGLSLRAYLDQLDGGLSVLESLDLVISLCDAVSIIHRAGLLHCDIKPSNIMLTPGNRPVLLDLGVSLHEKQWQSTHGLVGSPPYLAPEWLERASHRGLGYPVDIYSLGCLMYELLTGRVPFPAIVARHALSQHLHRPPPRLSDAVEVPEQLDRLVFEMMSKMPSQRPQSVDVVSAWLRGIRRGQLAASATPAPSLDVLIADDDEEMRELLASFIEQTVDGATVRLAVDGEDALREIRRGPPDVLLLDLDMPKLSGIELCMLLRGTSRVDQTAIAAISGTSKASDRELLRQLGVTEFISKRENIGELLGQLSALWNDRARMRKAAHC